MSDALARVLAWLQAEQLTTPDVFASVAFSAGERFISQGDPDTTVYVLTAGAVRITRSRDGHAEEVATLEAPTIVGELAAFSQARNADVTAQTPVEALAIAAATVRDLCRKDRDFARSFNELIQARTPVATIDANMRAAASTSPEEQEKLVTAMRELARQHPEIFEEVSVTPDPFEPFIREGQALDRVYLILAGEANVSQPGGGGSVTVGPGSPIGEVAAFAPGGLATATVRFTRQSDLLSLSRDHFRDLRKDADALVAERVNQSFTRALSPAAKEILRGVRDHNTEALLLRAALDIVTSTAGIYKVLNPAAGAGVAANIGSGVIREKSSVIGAVASLLRVARNRADIAAMVAGIRGHGLQGMPALKMFKGEAALIREDWLDRTRLICKPHLPEPLTFDDFDAVRRRFELIEWLDAALLADGALDSSRLPGATGDERLRSFLSSQERPQGLSVVDALDDLFESLIAAGLARGSKTMIEDLRGVQFQKIRAQVAGPSGAAAELPADHAARAALSELRARLARGERSAIGGADYATQQFPQVLLDRILEGAVKVVVFDGTPVAGRAFAAARFAPASSDPTQPQYMTTEVQGLDGSGDHTLLTFHSDGTQVLLLSGHGVSRQRHNAASVLLYERNRRRAGDENLILAGDGLAYLDVMRADIECALADEASRATVLGERVDHPALSTTLLMLQHPREFDVAFKTVGCELRYASGALSAFYVGYARMRGAVARYIIPKVGGRGLYGDAAGAFVRACFNAGIPKLSRDVVFSGTAGGLIEAVKPGGSGEESLLCPSGRIARYEGQGRLSEFAVDSQIRGPLADRLRSRVTMTSSHISVGAHGEETYELLREFVGAGFESIDVEGAAIAEAVAAVNGRLTPIYALSGNPLQREHDPFDRLAVMGPFFEGSRFSAPLWDVLSDVLADLYRS